MYHSFVFFEYVDIYGFICIRIIDIRKWYNVSSMCYMPWMSSHAFQIILIVIPKFRWEVKEYISKVPYADVVGCLHTSWCALRMKSLMQSIWSVGIYGSSKKIYWNAINWIFRYHIHTCDYSILFDGRACIDMWMPIM